MLTLFTTPKHFRGHYWVIQRNAIQSWKLLHPASEVILFGNEADTARIAVELKVRHIPEVECNEFGTPLLNSLFEQAEKLATNNFLCYINADIILTSDFIQALQQVASQKSRFLMIGQRWDVDINEPLEFSSGWVERLKLYVIENGCPQVPAGMDYFVFPRGLWDEILPFAIGRTYWDNWLNYKARLQRAALVDASQVVMAIHQNHDYSHAAGGANQVWNGPEAKLNKQLAGPAYGFNLQNSTHLLTPSGLKWALDKWHLRQHITTLPLLYPYWPIRLVSKLVTISRPIRTRLGLNFYTGDSKNA